MGFGRLITGMSVVVLACCSGSDRIAANGPAPAVRQDLGPQGQLIAKSLFGAKAGPSAQAAEPFGSYANGCAGGLVQLPESGPTWQAMRLSRNRNWAHPQTVDMVQDLSLSLIHI